MYGDVKDREPDPQDSEAYIEFMIKPWKHGMPYQLLEAVVEQPGHFAPAVRDRLMRLPPTFEEYLADLKRSEHLYCVSATRETDPFGPESARLLVVVRLLGRDHAEPILREFADAVLPLALEAERRYRTIEDQWQAEWDRLGRPVGDARDDHETLRTLGARYRLATDVKNNLTGAWTRSVSTAGGLGSPIFVDDVAAMLGSPDPVARRIGSWMAQYVINFSNERPDGVAALRAAADRLRVSEDLEDQLAAVRIEIALDPSREGLTDPEYRRLRDLISRQRR
ncbi:MAG: hypothetical protein D6692_04485 [Planctomycetota bacterium]|nr:MAG: hypothetical protein D6692_04485 [Planctomycetota bacterium]